MVPLPLFKLGTLFLRHISKYGANAIKRQAHEHPSFRKIAAQYGQYIHQINMRVSVAVLRDVNKERQLKEKAEAPTVKTEEQTRAEDEAKAKGKEAKPPPTSVWRRQFRALPEAKAVDLFADVIGDAFILGIGVALLLWETMRTKKPEGGDKRDELHELQEVIEAGQKRIEELEAAEEQRERRVETLEQAMQEMRQQTLKKKYLAFF